MISFIWHMKTISFQSSDNLLPKATLRAIHSVDVISRDQWMAYCPFLNRCTEFSVLYSINSKK